MLGADPRPMTMDTIFDLASLTKAVATTTAIMKLADAGLLDLSARVARYWPEFADNGKAQITLRELLTHYSGLPQDLDLSTNWRGYATGMSLIVAAKPVAPPGTTYLYSDLNFEILGEIVRRVSGTPFDEYCRDHIFAPLRMHDTGFRPGAASHDRIAPTEDFGGHVHWGEVHDATARSMGGVSGNAGLFSTADDLANFARMLLNRGTWNGARILSAAAIDRMTRVESPPGGRARGYGWDLGGADGEKSFPPGSYGHLGFTGTMLWIDPDAGLFAVVLTNRVYPDGTGDAGPLRASILQLIATSLGAAANPGSGEGPPGESRADQAVPR